MSAGESAGTKIEPVALSRDTSRQRNWRHRYLITDETGQFPVEIGNEHLAGKATHAISTLMRRGVHVVENNDARWHLAAFLRYKPRGRIIRVPRTGWHEGEEAPLSICPTGRDVRRYGERQHRTR